MKRHYMVFLFPLLIASGSLAGCGPSLKDAPGIGTVGFISENCFRALIVIEADADARGLVARRESASRKAEDRSLVHRMAVDQLAGHAIESGIQEGTLPVKASSAGDAAVFRERAVDILARSIGRGHALFSYYNENHAMVVGYEIRGSGLRGRVAAMITSMGE